MNGGVVVQPQGTHGAQREDGNDGSWFFVVSALFVVLPEMIVEGLNRKEHKENKGRTGTMGVDSWWSLRSLWSYPE